MSAAQKKWRERVAAWSASGLSCKEYAAKAGVNPRTLTWWKSKLGSCEEPVTFAEVKEPAAPAEEGVIEVAVGGARIYVRGRVDAESLARVLEALEVRR